MQYFSTLNIIASEQYMCYKYLLETQQWLSFEIQNLSETENVSETEY